MALMEVPSSAARTRASRSRSASIFRVMLVFKIAPLHVQHYFTCYVRSNQWGFWPNDGYDRPNEEYDRIYVLRIKEVDGKKEQTFNVDHQGLNDSLSNKCSGAVKGFRCE